MEKIFATNLIGNLVKIEILFDRAIKPKNRFSNHIFRGIEIAEYDFICSRSADGENSRM